MEFNLTTFILEIVNFLALVWVLKRFLYVPVRKGLEERAVKVRQALSEAQDAKQEAERLQAQYDGRMKTWEEEKSREKEKFQAELEALREKQMARLKLSLEQERVKGRKAEEQRLAELVEEGTREAMRQAAEFASKLLSHGATAEMERWLVDGALQSLSKQGNAQVWLSGVGEPLSTVQVKTAYPLSKVKRDELAALLQQHLGARPTLECKEDPKLLAGLEVTLGSVVLRANLRDELVFFAKAGVP
jgi:F-type H+-transporting ATPase subunit b